jgi:hypothetical protein
MAWASVTIDMTNAPANRKMMAAGEECMRTWGLKWKIYGTAYQW